LTPCPRIALELELVVNGWFQNSVGNQPLVKSGTKLGYNSKLKLKLEPSSGFKLWFRGHLLSFLSTLFVTNILFYFLGFLVEGILWNMHLILANPQVNRTHSILKLFIIKTKN
jgi:hypothetical protein